MISHGDPTKEVKTKEYPLNNNLDLHLILSFLTEKEISLPDLLRALLAEALESRSMSSVIKSCRELHTPEEYNNRDLVHRLYGKHNKYLQKIDILAKLALDKQGALKEEGMKWLEITGRLELSLPTQKKEQLLQDFHPLLMMTYLQSEESIEAGLEKMQYEIGINKQAESKPKEIEIRIVGKLSCCLTLTIKESDDE